MAGMQRGAIFSGIFHLVVILLAWFGLPQLIVEPPEPERPIIVELAQIGDVTNPPPAPQPQQQAEEQPEPPKPEPPKPEPQKAPPPPPPPPPKPAEPAPPPEPAPKPKEKAPEPKPEAPKSSPLAEVKPKKKPEPPAEDFIKNVLKSVDKPKPQTDDFDKMLKKMTESSPKKDEKPQTQAPAAKPTPAGSPISSMNQQYTITEQDFIRAYIQKNWSPPVGAKDVVVVQISFTLRPDGAITDVRYENTRGGDTLWQSFADSARRAVLLSSPIPVPQKSGRSDERVIVTFDPREMMGYSKPR